MAAPQVTGLAALLAAETPDYPPEEIRERIERTAEQLPVGTGSESTAPGADPNEAEDGNYDGDDNEGGDHQRLDSEPYRGEGHIDTLAALR
jgi:subtilisin family serine protease